MPIAFTVGFWWNRHTSPGSEKSPLPTAHLDGRYWFRAGLRAKGASQVLWTALVTLWPILKGTGHWVTASNSFAGLIPYLQLCPKRKGDMTFPRALLLALRFPTDLNLQHLCIALWQWIVLSSSIVIKRFCWKLGQNKKTCFWKKV